MAISTQAASDHAILSELIDYGLRVNDGEIADPSFHLTLHCAPEGADPWSEERGRLRTRRWATSAAWRTSSAGCAGAVGAVEGSRVPQSDPEPAGRGRGEVHRRAEWEACGEAPAVVPKQRCFAGLDLSGGRDLTALVLVFPLADGSFDVLCRFFLPENGIDDRDDREPWQSGRGRGT